MFYFIDTDWIPKTDNREERIQIGMEIERKNPQLYTEQLVKRIWEPINKYCSERTEEQKRNLYYMSLYDYWVFGISIEEEIYLNLETKTDEERSEYITDRNRWDYYRYLNNPDDWHLLRNKYEAYQLLKEYYKRDMIELKGEEDRMEFDSFVEKHPEFVVKPVGGSGAYGVKKISLADYADTDELFRSLMQIMEDSKKLSRLESVKSLVLEELIEQVEELAAFHPSSINAIRLITIRNGDQVSFFYPWIKFGASGSFIASAAIDGFDAGIDPATGIIVTDGCKESGESVEVHPDSGIRFKGYQIPKWDELLEFGKEIALKLPTFRYVGWDVVLTPKGWCIMEGNHAGQIMSQMIYKRGLRREFEEMIQWPGNN